MKNTDRYNSIIINFLFLMFPISLMLGNPITNLNIFLICLFAFIFYNKKITKFKINIFDKIILIFFLCTILSLIVNYIDAYLDGRNFPRLIIDKTLLYLRYLVLYLILRVLISQKILRVDWFSYTCAICAAFLCLDIFFQFFFGIQTPYPNRHSGIFGTELIAGTYLQKFALFFLFLPFLLKKNFFYTISIQFAFFFIFLLGIMFTGNRAPFILYILSFLIYLILDKNLRKYFFSIFVIIFLILSLYFVFNKHFAIKMHSFYQNGEYLIKTLLTKDLIKEPEEVWLKSHMSEVYCSSYSFIKNPIFGGGVRSYRTHINCNTHPHNYYIEIVSDLGLLGLSIILIFVFMLLYKILIKKISPFQFHLRGLDSRSMPFFLIFFIEFFPLRTTGSFFTTNNASTIFLILAILVSLISPKKINNN
jgi:O-antigen ligase